MSIDIMSTPDLTDDQFLRLSAFIQKNVGIKMPDEKRIMVQSRLNSRLKALKIKDFDSYLEYAFAPTEDGMEEIAHLINAITTNLTNFFREQPHFDYMTSTVLPEFAKKGLHRIELWSAGCSSGQEPYTLSIVMSEFMRTHPNAFRDFSILATDISSKVLNKGLDAVYQISEIDKVPFDLKKRYFLKSKDPAQQKCRVNKETREKVTFMRLNFMDSHYPVSSPKNIIFCRNVLIYFNKQTQEAVIRKLIEHLVPGGYLFLGHSETIFGMNLPLVTVAPTVFKKL